MSPSRWAERGCGACTRSLPPRGRSLSPCRAGSLRAARWRPVYRPITATFNGCSLEWPAAELPNGVFALVRPDTAHAAEILAALRSLDAAIVCIAPGFTEAQLVPFRASMVVLSSRLATLSKLTTGADLCVSYGAEGTMLSFLFAGVPQVISPYHVGTHLMARRRSLQREFLRPDRVRCASHCCEEATPDLLSRDPCRFAAPAAVGGEYVAYAGAASIASREPHYLSYLFRREMGKTFVNWRREHRTSVAIAALEEGQRSIDGIVKLVGYRSRRSLKRALKEASGRTAGSFKRKRPSEKANVPSGN